MPLGEQIRDDMRSVHDKFHEFSMWRGWWWPEELHARYSLTSVLRRGTQEVGMAHGSGTARMAVAWRRNATGEDNTSARDQRWWKEVARIEAWTLVRLSSAVAVTYSKLLQQHVPRFDDAVVAQRKEGMQWCGEWEKETTSPGRSDMGRW
jgi:hypothetical protein